MLTEKIKRTIQVHYRFGMKYIGDNRQCILSRDPFNHALIVHISASELDFALSFVHIVLVINLELKKSYQNVNLAKTFDF